MKILTVFMTLLILVAGFDLCESSERCHQDEKSVIEKAADESHAATEGICSDFCQCSRCTFSMLAASRLREDVLFTFCQGAIANRSSFSPIQIGASIWQPPKYS